MLEAGWSPARVHLYLVGRHGKDADVPTEKALERYRAAGNVRPVKVLPARLVDQALRSLRRKVNVLRTVDDMIAFQEERLVWLRQREIESGEPMREVSLSLRVLELYLDRRQRLARELGLDEVDQQASDDGPDPIPLRSVAEITEILQWHKKRGEEREAEQAEEALRAEADERARMEAGSAEGVAAADPWTNDPTPDGDAWAGGPRSDRDTQASDPAPDGHEWPTAPPSNGDAWLDLRQRTFARMQVWAGPPRIRRAA